MADMNVQIKVDRKSTRRLHKALGAWPKLHKKVLSRAINKTSNRVRVFSVRGIAADMKLKNKDIFQKRNRSKPLIQTLASFTNLISTIATSPRRIPLIAFKAQQAFKRQTKKRKAAGLARKSKGVSYNLGQGRKTVPGGWVMNVRGRSRVGFGEFGHLGVFTRKGKARFPIRELFGPSTLHVYDGEQDIYDEAVDKANKWFPKEVNTQIDLLLKTSRNFAKGFK